jgi:hypothetical protein
MTNGKGKTGILELPQHRRQLKKAGIHFTSNNTKELKVKS